MGDLTQSLYLLRDLHQAEGNRVSVLVDKRLEGFLGGRAPWIDTVYTLDLERYLRGFRQGTAWTDLWQTLNDELRPLAATCFDRIVNLNYGRLAGTVIEAVRGETPVEGFHIGREGSFGDPWVRWFSRLVQSNRRWNRFHLVDVFRFHSRRRIPSDGVKTKPPRPLGERSVLGVQMATRCPKRTWGVDGFVEVIRTLQRELGCEILLLGESRERPRAERVVRMAGAASLRNLVGKTTLEDLVQILGTCDRLLSGDTGTLHLAAYLGTPCVAIFFGPAYVFETGPYGNGHLILQAEPSCGPCGEEVVCREETCRALVSPDAVLKALQGDVPDPVPHLQAYASGFLEDWMQVRPLNRRKATRDDVLGLLYWGTAGAFLGEPQGRLPSLEGTLRFFAHHYRADLELFDAVEDTLASSVPETLGDRERERLLGILREGWARMREAQNGHMDQEPFRLATAAA